MGDIVSLKTLEKKNQLKRYMKMVAPGYENLFESWFFIVEFT